MGTFFCGNIIIFQLQINHCPVSSFDITILFQVVKLYERCLIACASYPEYWIRYVLCMEASGSMELANNALARATQVFVKVCSVVVNSKTSIKLECLWQAILIHA